MKKTKWEARPLWVRFIDRLRSERMFITDGQRRRIFLPTQDGRYKVVKIEPDWPIGWAKKGETMEVQYLYPSVIRKEKVSSIIEYKMIDEEKKRELLDAIRNFA